MSNLGQELEIIYFFRLPCSVACENYMFRLLHASQEKKKRTTH